MFGMRRGWFLHLSQEREGMGGDGGGIPVACGGRQTLAPAARDTTPWQERLGCRWFR